MMARVFAKGLALALWCGISSHATPEVRLSSCIPHMGSAALAAGSGVADAVREKISGLLRVLA